MIIMKKYFLLLAGVLTLALTGCKKDKEAEPAAPGEEQSQEEVIPASFPKKHLIEEFTGQGCGYCPEGMNSISTFTQGESRWVTILHHYGYAADHFSVAGSKTITNALGVSGAPSMCINRKMTNLEDGSKIVFHPGYLPTVDKTQFETETYASVVIRNCYDEASRKLTVTVSGALCREDYPSLQLTVLLKESGMIDTQSDYYYTYEGWEQFRHTNAVRAYMTLPKGDSLTIDSTRHYTATYSTTLKTQWVPENCMVVAFLSEAFKPVVQAEEAPVVAGTQGGADQEHGGIKAVPVPDYYPEPDATNGPNSYSASKFETLTNSTAYYKDYPEEGIRQWLIEAYDPTADITVANTRSVPFTHIYLFTEPDAKSIPAGEYTVNGSGEKGTVMAGYRDDTKARIDGSMFYFISYSYLQQGYLVPTAQWLVSDGTLTVAEDGTWSLVGHARNGADIRVKGTTPMNAGGAMNVQKRKIQRL